ncbi:MAG TPA: mechanosensitive ion channel family protein [Methylomirabilota bacterium]|nr:mechanosensitive ion channel family protein [Methylomirabilota bacterium]
MDMNVLQSAIPLLTLFVLKVVGAVALWIVGRALIRLAMRMLVRTVRHSLDQTVAGYIGTATSVLLNIALIVAILGFFGVETTSFAALMAGVGIAIGAAWSGLLAQFAAGVFLLILRPFKVGDFVSVGGMQGTVEEIGLFVTRVNTPDNVQTFISNSKVFSDTIQNFSASSYRRVDLVAQLHNAVDHLRAIALLRERLAKIPNVVSEPRPDVEILSFNPLGPVLAVRPYCSNEHYWQVYFDTNRAIREVFGDAGFPAPEQPIFVRTNGERVAGAARHGAS